MQARLAICVDYSPKFIFLDSPPICLVFDYATSIANEYRKGN
jgi:hypothetical protein